MRLWPKDWPVADNHCADVLAGGYDLPFEMDAPVICDVGANIGAFAKWAASRWKNATIHCFEPFPLNVYMLKQTVETLPATVFFHPIALLDHADYLKLIPGACNCGEFSLFGAPGANKENAVTVTVVDAAILPRCDILKLDAEGSETFIIQRLIALKRIQEPKAIMLEWHREADVEPLISSLEKEGFRLWERHDYSGARGLLKFLR